MPETKTHTGGCHCGKVRYEVAAAFDKVIECNCSICSKKAHLLSFVDVGQFKLLSGEESLTKYQFNKKHIDHLFCSVCGIQSFARGTKPDGTSSVAINVRCIDDVDLATLERMPFDGRSK